MAKKRKPVKPHPEEFKSSPFSPLKGFAVSGQHSDQGASDPNPDPIRNSDYERSEKAGGTFAEAMERLGVQPLETGEDVSAEQLATEQHGVEKTSEVLSDEELFLREMEGLKARFEDRYPERGLLARPLPRRMRQVRQGTLIPEASLDLHGALRSEVAGKLSQFLDNARYHGWKTLLVITGKGLHSEGEPVVRGEVERFLISTGNHSVAEWGRAPQKYGGEGALILFLRTK